jgi:hypothetical protein
MQFDKNTIRWYVKFFYAPLVVHYYQKVGNPWSKVISTFKSNLKS